MTKKDLTNIGLTALITLISVSLPGYLYLRGLPWPWALALFGGLAAVAILAYQLGKRLK